MVLLRRVIGDALRARRQSQRRTLREVSTSANVSLGYLSEIERGQKEASSELLSSICDALGAQLSEVLRDVSDTMALAEQMEEALAPVSERSAVSVPAEQTANTRVAEPAANANAANARAAVPNRVPARTPAHAPKIVDGKVSVAVRHEGPLKTTLRATRADRDSHDGDLVYA
jgi:transcriptional regulator with XRE-family HTH domain